GGGGECRERGRCPSERRRYSSDMTTASEPPATLAGIDPEGIDARTIPGVFFRQARASADRVVFRHYRDDRWQPVTWAEMRESAVRVGCALVKAGVQPREKVILMAHNK